MLAPSVFEEALVGDNNQCCGHAVPADSDSQAAQLAALVLEARLLELGLEGGGDAERRLAADLEDALTDAMDADSPGELTQARDAIGVVLGRLVRRGMALTARMTHMDVEGVLGTTRMPVLTAVLSAPAAA